MERREGLRTSLSPLAGVDPAHALVRPFHPRRRHSRAPAQQTISFKKRRVCRAELRSIDFNVYAFFCRENLGSPDFLPLRVDDIRVRRFRCSLAKRSRSTKQCRNEDEVLVAHSNLPGYEVEARRLHKG